MAAESAWCALRTPAALKRRYLLLCACAMTLALLGSGAATAQQRITWRQCLSQRPEWYSSQEAVRIADNVLLYQRASGGWPKNEEMAAVLGEKERAALAGQRDREDSTIDNGATYRQMAYLAKVYHATGSDRLRDAFLKGMEFLLRAQYANGGWPQYFPNPSGYSRHITYNDNAMVGVMSLLREVSHRAPEYAFVGEERRARVERAVQRGIECILKCQVRVQGTLTVWCAQHHERTLAPAPARSYEKVSLSGAESVGIVRFLMGIEKPSPAVVEAVEAAVAWFEAVKLTGIRQVNQPDVALPGGYDRVIVPDPTAPPLWARFYEIGTNRPIFSGRDGVIKYRLADIEHERRTGYAWYTSAPADLLAKEYPAWKARRARAGSF